MNDVSTYRVRRLTIDDFQFVRDLAAQQANFTIPPLYVLWLLTRIKGDICLVAEDPIVGPAAYLLCVPMDDPPDSLFIWQLASRDTAKPEEAIQVLLQQLRAVAAGLETRRIFFTCIPGSATFRAIRRYSMTLVGKEPQPCQDLPTFIAPGESEFRIDLD